jgi:hypothetical protein
MHPGFKPQRARLSPPQCLTCLLGLQGVQWVRQISVWFGFYKKKVTRLIFKTKTLKPVQTNRFWFGFFRTKIGSNRFDTVFLVLIGFFDLAQFFSRSARFFSGLGSIRFF